MILATLATNQKTMIETWKPIPSTKGKYEASSLGRIRLAARVVAQNKGNRYGHLYCTIMMGRNDKRYVAVHSLVAEAFLGPKPDGMISLHGDKGKFDNSIQNIRYGTRRENFLDMMEFGDPASAEQMARTRKLSDEQVREIRRRVANGERGSVLGREYGIDRSQVSRIAGYKTYRWVR